jgi:hypothetical protein
VMTGAIGEMVTWTTAWIGSGSGSVSQDGSSIGMIYGFNQDCGVSVISYMV